MRAGRVEYIAPRRFGVSRMTDFLLNEQQA
jgi:hypothetical protein